LTIVKDDHDRRSLGSSSRRNATAGDARDVGHDGSGASDARVTEMRHSDKLITLGQLAARAAHDSNGELVVLQHYVGAAIRHAHALQTRDARQLTHADLDALMNALAQIRDAALYIADTTRDMRTDARGHDSPPE